MTDDVNGHNMWPTELLMSEKECECARSGLLPDHALTAHSSVLVSIQSSLNLNIFFG